MKKQKKNQIIYYHGKGEAKVTQHGTQEKTERKATATIDDDNGKQETKSVVTNEMKENWKPRNETENIKKKSQTRQVVSGAISLHNKKKNNKKKHFYYKE